MKPQAALFDLDGTLVDTAPDLALALNLLRERHGLPRLPLETIRPYASHGSRGLLRIGFGLSPEEARFAVLREEYLDLYAEMLTRSPLLFPGIGALLDDLETMGVSWGVVTNKPRRFTQPLLQALDLTHRAACIVSGDDVASPKPSPDSLLLASEMAAVAPQSCIYIGDAERDIQAGRAAEMLTIIALYGYLDARDRPNAWGADFLVETPDALGVRLKTLLAGIAPQMNAAT